MKPNPVRKPLPGLALIFYLTLAITMVRDLSQLVTSIGIYAENWAAVPHTLALADLMLRAVSLLLGGMMLWLLSRRDARFLLALILNLISQMMFVLFNFLVLRAANPSAMGSLILSAVWYTYFRFSPKVAAVLPIPGAPAPDAQHAPAPDEADEEEEDAEEPDEAEGAHKAQTPNADAQEEDAQDAQGTPRR